jgi:hypothetical protein
MEVFTHQVSECAFFLLHILLKHTSNLKFSFGGDTIAHTLELFKTLPLLSSQAHNVCSVYDRP